ncbi:hypothetical protein COY26_00355 [Candidatus Woesearchaeota archaeon CG_4_10_14_0_2_um_filter_33_10]|nr:MAG: hypothetical protein AUJ83_02045 [Candidatus Woesearchaeota archaeon CG1_02_33_12]PIN79235.1 MAG: hypothetical protein COV14_00420 [Candidatus Woesearchaeota archaeon CG10_big_fil_rev_8_21_14_0_10_33_12]PIU72535.1 MAG: hypothetical protein COS79_02405 [Candidatus Woesearchaeota archaeon CG06_land_8_20_14_3_00_33_13]PIZ53989.1 MAG: hypothetical protein COY26_00355 [Candidatus Woesearchaeota archaeon CG_4_10_14_0_2_um_filter_33_10]
MQLIKEAFEKLYPNKVFNYSVKIKYTARFKPYNANVRYTKNNLEFSLSRQWKHISKDIVIGLIQSLLLKVFNDKKQTINIDLYNYFIRNLHISIPKQKSDPTLESSFNRVNKEYFYNIVEIPNLEWGSNSKRKLGSYDYHTDTISISRIFIDAEPELLDYLMYHEMLHKKLKFNNKDNRSYHHTREFKEKEKEFNNYKEMDKKIKMLIRKSKYKEFLNQFSW